MSKRRKVDGTMRLALAVDEMKSISDDLLSVVRGSSDRKARNLRVVAAPKTSSSSSGSNATSFSLLPLVSVLELQDSDKTQNDSDSDPDQNKKNTQWRDELPTLAAQLGDSDAVTKCASLMRRFDALTASVGVVEQRLRQQTDDVLISERVETQLEQEEQLWENQMQRKEHQVAELELALQQWQQQTQSQTRTSDDDDNDDDVELHSASTESETHASELEHLSMEESTASRVEMEHRALQEAWALRVAERRDMDAAMQALRRTSHKRRLEKLVQSENETDREDALEQQRQMLVQEKQELQQAILHMETQQEQIESEQQDVVQLKQELEFRKNAKVTEQELLDKNRVLLTRFKDKMRHMVQLQLLRAKDSSPPNLQEEAMILHLLYQHAGEMGMNELKTETAEHMLTYGKPSSGGAIVRALYSLVGNGIVQIDRSFGTGLVTSLLV